MHKQKTAIISVMAKKYAERLEAYSGGLIKTILIEPDGLLDAPVSSHPDMIFCILGEKLFVPLSYYNEHAETIKRIASSGGLTLETSNADRGLKYPSDIGFNVLVTQNHIFSLTERTAPEILSEAKRLGMTSVRVKQGYSACSALVAGNCVISADPSILRSVESRGYDTLRINEGGVRINGYNTGFIGGASGICGKTAYFFGNIMLHPDGERICEKLSSHGFNIASLSDDMLTDFGGIKFI